MAVIHISEADAARDFAGLMAPVRAGVEVVIDGASPAVKLSIAATRPGRLLPESIALAESHAKELGYEPVMDAGSPPTWKRSSATASRATRRHGTDF